MYVVNIESADAQTHGPSGLVVLAQFFAQLSIARRYALIVVDHRGSDA